MNFFNKDGNYCFEGVKRDFEINKTSVRRSSILAIHEIVVGPKLRVGALPKFLREFKKEILKNVIETIEIVNFWYQRDWI